MKRSSGHQFTYILFDLDETLYPKEAGLMRVLNERMLTFMINKLNIPADDVAAKRRTYYQQYGTTLVGLMEDYKIDPQEYLRFVHDLDPQDFLGPSPPLADMLQEIPLQKAIFTNASLEHTERILDVLQVRHHFDEIIDINTLDFKCKPNPVAYQRALMLLEVTGEECILVEDSPRNLAPAKDLGMTTILIDETGTSPMGVDFVVPTIFHVGQVVKNLLPDSLIW